MFVQRLREYYARTLAESTEPAFEKQWVRWLLRVSEDGRFFGPLVDLATQEGRRGRQYGDVPKTAVSRSGGSIPLLGIDELAYVFGSGKWTEEKDKPKHQRHHRAFVAFLQEAAEKTGDPGLKACSAFYGRPADVSRAKEEVEKENSRNGRVAFTLSSDDQKPVFQREAAKKFWREQFSLQGAPKQVGVRGKKPTASGSECLCCGKVGLVQASHGTVKNVPNGQGAGCYLMSFGKDAFRSHGWDKNSNSPTCPECAEAYVRALNHLMDRNNVPRTRLDIGDVAFIFWTRDPSTGFDPASWLQEADPRAVEELLFSAQRGQFDENLDDNAFYAAALSGSGGRIMVREWIESTIGEAKRNLAAWFEDLRIVTVNKQRDKNDRKRIIREAGETAIPPKIYFLCASTAVKKEQGYDVSPHVPAALMRAALKGTMIPSFVLEACLRRVRLAEDGGKDPKFKPERMALIKACLNRSGNAEKGEHVMTECINETCADHGYVCGRLLSVLAYVQAFVQDKRQHGYGAGAQIVERFYGSASTAPRSVFPVLMRLNRHHLRKVAEESPGFATNREKEIEELMCLLRGDRTVPPDFPPLLDLKGQGRFALGFYHQRAEFRRTASVKPEAKTVAA